MDEGIETLAFVELTASLFAIFSVLFIIKMQGFDTTLTWAVLPFLSMIRIIGSSAQLRVDDNAEAFELNELLDTTSFAPILISLLCLSQRMNALMPHSIISMRIFLSLYILVALAAALVLIGELMFLGGTDSEISVYGDLEVKAGLMLLAIVLFVTIVINGIFFSRLRKLTERIEQLMLCCVIQSTPLLAVRLGYTFVSRYQAQLFWRSMNRYIVSRALAVILMEVLSVSLYLFVGYLDRPKQDRLAPGKESHTEKREKVAEMQNVVYEYM